MRTATRTRRARRCCQVAGHCARTGKDRYRDHRSASWAIARITTKHPQRESLPIRSYQCPFCHDWHLTSLAS